MENVCLHANFAIHFHKTIWIVLKSFTVKICYFFTFSGQKIVYRDFDRLYIIICILSVFCKFLTRKSLEISLFLIIWILSVCKDHRGSWKKTLRNILNEAFNKRNHHMRWVSKGVTSFYEFWIELLHFKKCLVMPLMIDAWNWVWKFEIMLP